MRARAHHGMGETSRQRRRLAGGTRAGGPANTQLAEAGRRRLRPSPKMVSAGRVGQLTCQRGQLAKDPTAQGGAVLTFAGRSLDWSYQTSPTDPYTLA